MYIYKITNLVNNKIYIGLSTKSVEESMCYFGSGRLINEAILKYGKENFHKEIIEDNVTDFEKLKNREIYWIDSFKSHVDFDNYNLTLGGDGVLGFKPTKETKKILSKKTSNSNKERWKDPEYRNNMLNHLHNRSIESREKVGNSLRGIPKSDMARKNMSIAKKGKPQSDKAKESQRIVQSGMKYYYNPVTKVKTRSKEELPYPWIKSSARTIH